MSLRSGWLLEASCESTYKKMILRIWENYSFSSKTDFQNYYLLLELKNFSFNARVKQSFFVPYSALSWKLSLRLEVSTLEWQKKIQGRNKNKTKLLRLKITSEYISKHYFLPLQKIQVRNPYSSSRFSLRKGYGSTNVLIFFQEKVMLKFTYDLIYLKFLFCFGKVKDETRMTGNVILGIIFL